MTSRCICACLLACFVALGLFACSDTGSSQPAGRSGGASGAPGEGGRGLGGGAGGATRQGMGGSVVDGRGGAAATGGLAAGGAGAGGGGASAGGDSGQAGRDSGGLTGSASGGDGGSADVGGLATGGAGAGSGGQTGGSCSVTIKSKTLSTVIPTVGIVEWATELPGLTEASIEFGLDTSYGMSAPVDLKEASYRTLILGMKAGGKTYHFRVVAKAGDKVCTGADNTLPPTGEPPNSLPQLTFTPTKASGLAGGFLVFETLRQTFGSGVPDSPAYIVDGDGDFVWWYTHTGIIDVGRVRQSYDGKYMWIAAVNVLSGKPRVIRIKMDGTDEKDFTKEFADLNHDFAIRSDETIAFLAYGSNDCDDIKERRPDGTVTTIINSGTAVGASACHCNALHYDRSDDTIVFSELDSSSIVKVSRDTKKVVWLMSSQNSGKATITGLTWKNQHGFHIIDPRRFLFFNNNTGPNSAVIEAELSPGADKGTAKQTWSYASNLTVQILGDVQRLDNGNTLITFSTANEIREVSPSGTVLQTIKSVGSGNLFGFSEKRRSLYGPPPR